tara:strand:- start:845 stop:2767 length:1923 start_codon:yes stop_codon:yes gene_type:complete
MFRLVTLLFLTTSAWATDPTFTVGTESIINIQNSGTALNLGDDSMSGMKDIGFDFTFYDQTFDQVNISMNGFFTFQSNFNVSRQRNYLSETLPASSFNYSVFPMWTDLINRDGTQNPYIQTFGNTSDADQYFVIGWYNAKEYSNQLQNTFEAILYEGTNTIEFRYDKIQVRSHNFTIGVQGNNEATTYLRYLDNNNTTYIETDDFSLTTAEVIDESFSNLSSECLVNSSYSELCDVYDLTNDSNDDNFLYGIDEDIIFGYDEDETIFGFSTDEDEQFFSFSVGLEDNNDWNDDGSNIDTIFILSDTEPDQGFNLEDDSLLIHIDSEYDIEFVDALPDLEEEFLEIVDIETEEVVQFFEEVQERVEEDFLVFVEEEVIEEEIAEVIEELFDEEEAIEEEEELLDESIDEISPEEIEEEVEENQFKRRNISTTRNTISNLVTSVVRGSYASSGSSSSNNNNGSVNVSGTTLGSVNSPTVSNQVAADQVQTNNVLQSITIMPMPGVDNTPSVAMAEVQITTMENQIENVTSSVMTASEADQVADQIVAQNIQAQQEANERNQNESGEYSMQGQANLLAYMGYSPGFNDYQNMNIPDGANWYESKTIYANIDLGDNINGYNSLVGTNLNQQSGLIQTQNMEIFR